MGNIDTKRIERFILGCAFTAAVVAAGAAFYFGQRSVTANADKKGIAVSFTQAANGHSRAALENHLAAKVNEYFTARGLPVDPVTADKKVGDTLTRAKGPQP